MNYEILIFISTKGGLDPTQIEKMRSGPLLPEWYFDFRTREGKMII